ncbi:MAG: hypothetical protein R3F61_04195 [Myxococcota bacterium]
MHLVLALLGCNGSGTEPTYHRDARPVLDTRCATCHQPGGVGPFPMTTYEEVYAVRTAAALAIESGSMPPWQPAEGCAEYDGAFDLTPAERTLLLDFFAADAPEGDPADAVPSEPPPVFAADVAVKLPEAYTPVTEPDDYRCQILDWTVDTPQFITGVNIAPSNGAIAHHGIAFLIPGSERESYEALDAAEEGPGYTCFGGPTGAGGSSFGELGDLDLATLLALVQAAQDGESPEVARGMSWLASWVPGQVPRPFPEGTGVQVNRGDFVVLQMHYNTLSAAPSPDQSELQLQLTDTVERPAMTLPFTNPMWIANLEPMLIPANETASYSTSQSASGLMLGMVRTRLGLAADSPLEVHIAGLHMHALGTGGRMQVRHATGETSCLLEIDDWDFSWQGNYALTQPVTVMPDDEVFLGCSWDNTAANQIVVDGQALEPRDVTWGEGTTDEMCLGGMYLTGP